jgi:hypothetical protein
MLDLEELIKAEKARRAYYEQVHQAAQRSNQAMNNAKGAIHDAVKTRQEMNRLSDDSAKWVEDGHRAVQHDPEILSTQPAAARVVSLPVLETQPEPSEQTSSDGEPFVIFDDTLLEPLPPHPTVARVAPPAPATPLQLRAAHQLATDAPRTTATTPTVVSVREQE